MSELSAASAELAPVSVVMPIRNEERHLEESVRHVLCQDYPGEIEVVLAVGPSRDATMAIAERISAADPRITVIPNPTGQIPSALNLAVKAARHSVIARVDGHCLLPPGYLVRAVRLLAETGADDVGGIMAAEGVSPFERAVAWAMTSPFGVGASRFHTGGKAGPADTAYLGVYRRAAIERVGGYDETFLVAEDWELNHRITMAGGLIWFQPDLRVTYRPRASVRTLGRQYFRYGRWRRVVARQHAGTINLRYLAPPAAVVAMAAGIAAGVAGLAAGGGLGWLALGFLIPAGYLAGVLAITGLAARHLAMPVAARLPAVLATMHVCWGLGFLTSPRRLMPGARGAHAG
ncbi:MAG TPA: glycosyltransferase family 2 protein [Streptosporangiaceae bacterium]|jgi:glycosyltransferase involved in cell wall biosynthesis